MNPEAIIALIGTVITVATAAAKAGMDAAPFAKIIWDDIVNKKVVTAEDQASVEAKLAVLSADIQQPIQPEQPDDV